MEPKITVIIPAWNAAKYIQETINSVLHQSWNNFEILIIDNASCDDTVKVVESFQDPRIQVIRLAENKGASHARNVGLKHATGAYIQYLDADDLISPNKFQLQYEALRANSDAIAFGNVCFFWDGENPWVKNQEPNDQFYFDSDAPLSFLLNLYGLNGRAGMVPIHSWLCPKPLIDAAGPWNESLTVDDDGEYFCRVILASKRLSFVPETLVYYRKFKHRKSLSREQTHASMRSSFIAIESKHQACLRNSQESEEVRKVFALHFMEFADITWPEFPDLTQMALRRVAALGGTDHIPLIGNPILNKLKYIFGWKNMKWISWKKNQLLKRK